MIDPYVAMGVITVGCVALVFAEHRKLSWLRALAKMSASTGFLLLAWALGAFFTGYGQWVFGALVLSWVGDALLLSGREPVFQGGILAFLLAHVAFGIGFWGLGLDPLWGGAAAAVLAPIAALVLRWLLPHVEGMMRVAVLAYIAVIAVMVILAFAAFGAGGRLLIPIGATIFFLSDLAVARDRFVAPGFRNRVWGLPAYYVAQGMLASTVA